MSKRPYLYNVNYQEFDEPLWLLESRVLFGQVFEGKVFLSNKRVIPGHSPFLKNRIEVLHKADTFDDLIYLLKGDRHIFKNPVIKYIKLKSGDLYAANRKGLYKEISACLDQHEAREGEDCVYGLTHYENQWFFGPLVVNDGQWRDHSKRPHTYSNSLKGHLAKVLINAAGQGDISKSLIDPLCGAGTVLLEGCYAGYAIDGSDMNEKMARSAKANLAHFNYEATVKAEGIEAIRKHYHGAIIDLPYGLYSQTTKEKQTAILREAKRIADRVVIVSSEDIIDLIRAAGLNVMDACKVLKTKNKRFARYIWVCQ